MSITAFNLVNSSVQAKRIEVIGTLQGTAPGGAYKIPLRLVYPTGISPTLNRALIEPWNSVRVGTFGRYGLAVVEAGLAQMGAVFLAETMGYSYVSFEWSKQAVDAYHTAAAAPSRTAPSSLLTIAYDATWAIAAGGDTATIIADVSEFVRNPLAHNAFTSLSSPQTCAKVFGYGFSQTGTLMRGLAANGLNSSAGAALPNGLICEGIIAAQCGSLFRTQNNTGPNYFTLARYDGATPSNQGVMINLMSECDVFWMEGASGRDATNASHYAQYEIAGVPHTGTLFSTALYNPIGQGQVHKAMLENLRAKVDSGTALPTSTVLEGSIAQRSAAWMTTSVITGAPFTGGTSARTFTGVLSDDDGNYLGGIRLPHLHTRLADGRLFGAPLGNYRGLGFMNLSIKDNLLPTVYLTSPTPPNHLGLEFFGMMTGCFQPWEPALLSRRYRTIGDYVSMVGAAADHALSKKWILQADRDAYITAAAALTYQTLLDSGLRRTIAPTPIVL